MHSLKLCTVKTMCNLESKITPTFDTRDDSAAVNRHFNLNVYRCNSPVSQPISFVLWAIPNSISCICSSISSFGRGIAFMKLVRLASRYRLGRRVMSDSTRAYKETFSIVLIWESYEQIKYTLRGTFCLGKMLWLSSSQWKGKPIP